MHLRHSAWSVSLIVVIAVTLTAQSDTGSWNTYQKYDKWFHYSQTKVTPEGGPHLTCLDGQGSQFVAGSRGAGLFRFDTRSRRFEPYPGAEEFVQRQITAVSMGPGSGELFVGTYFSGLYHRTPAGRFERFGEAEGLPGTRVVALVRDGKGVWIGTDGGVARWSDGRLERTTVTRKVESLSIDARTGRVYAGHSSSEISVFDPSRNQWSTVTMGVQPPVTFKHLLVEPSGDILVGTFLGLFRINGRNGSVTDLTGDNEKKLISCLELGEDGNVYVGIFGKNKGMHLLKGNELTNLFRGYSGYSETSAFKRTSGGDYLLVSFGQLWHFTDRFVKDGTLREVDYRGPAPHALIADPDVPTTVPTDTGLAQLPPPPTTGGSVSLPPPPTFTPALPTVVPPTTAPPSGVAKPAVGASTVLEGQRVTAVTQSVGRLWVGTDRGELHLMARVGDVKQARTFGGAVTVLQYSAGGRLYIAAERTALYTFNGFSYRLVTRSGSDITALADGPNGEQYVGTRDGLFRTEGDKLVSVPVTLPDRLVTALVADGATLWVGTRLGLVRVADGATTSFGTADGLPAQDVRCLAVNQGRLWCGTGGGVATMTGSRFTIVAGGAIVALQSAGNDVLVARADGVARWSGGRLGDFVASPGGAVQAVDQLGTDVVVATDRGLAIVPATNLR